MGANDKLERRVGVGEKRWSYRDYAHFLSIARGSLYETMTQLELAQSLGYVGSINDAERLTIEISRMLTSLMKKYIPLSNSNSQLQLNMYLLGAA